MAELFNLALRQKYVIYTLGEISKGLERMRQINRENDFLQGDVSVHKVIVTFMCLFGIFVHIFDCEQFGEQLLQVVAELLCFLIHYFMLSATKTLFAIL